MKLAGFVFSSRLGLSSRLVTNGMAKTTKSFFNKIESLPDNKYITIRFEDLCQNPDQNIEKILN